MATEREPLLHEFVENHPGVSRRLAQAFGDEAALERSVRHGTSCWTSLPSLDAVLGRLPWGLIGIHGAESTGKTGLTYQILASAQKEGRPALFWATEVLDVLYMERTGVDTSTLPVLLGNREEDALDFLRSHKGAVLALDSVTALRPLKEKELTDWNDMAWRILHRLRKELQEDSCCVVVSQVRAKKLSRVGTQSASRRFEDLFDTKLELHRNEVQDEQFELLVDIQAHPLSTPHRYVKMPFIKGAGVDRRLDLLRAAKTMGIVEVRPGGWHYHLDVIPLGQGEAAALRKLDADPELKEQLEALVYEHVQDR